MENSVDYYAGHALSVGMQLVSTGTANKPRGEKALVTLLGYFEKHINLI